MLKNVRVPKDPTRNDNIIVQSGMTLNLILQYNYRATAYSGVPFQNWNILYEMFFDSISNSMANMERQYLKLLWSRKRNNSSYPTDFFINRHKLLRNTKIFYLLYYFYSYCRQENKHDSIQAKYDLNLLPTMSLLLINLIQHPYLDNQTRFQKHVPLSKHK